MATGSAATTCCAAAPSTACRQAAAWGVKRCSRPWGVIGVPAAAAACASWSREAVGLARKPKTRAWTKLARVGWGWRGMNWVEGAAVLAAVVKTVWRAAETYGMLGTRGSLGRMVGFTAAILGRTRLLCLA